MNPLPPNIQLDFNAFIPKAKKEPNSMATSIAFGTGVQVAGLKTYASDKPEWTEDARGNMRPKNFNDRGEIRTKSDGEVRIHTACYSIVHVGVMGEKSFLFCPLCCLKIKDIN